MVTLSEFGHFFSENKSECVPVPDADKINLSYNKGRIDTRVLRKSIVIRAP
jgi:hypothetical protein